MFTLMKANRTIGDDNKSVSSARDVAIALQQDQVTVDSVQVGTYSNVTLHKISVATNGYRFAPQTSLNDALSIFVRRFSPCRPRS